MLFRTIQNNSKQRDIYKDLKNTFEEKNHLHPEQQDYLQ